LKVIIRADMQGSLDALHKSLGEIPSDEVKLQVLHAAVGAITEGDVVLATASEAIIIGFNVTPESVAERMAKDRGVDVRVYRVIYDLIDDIRKALEGLLEPDRSEETRGKAEVRNVFKISRLGTVAGSVVTDGVIARSHKVRLIREGRIILPSEEDLRRGRHREIDSLRRFKDDAREVRSGLECGIRIAGYDDVKEGDIIEAYEVIETARKLS
jgi:translation initiation factor IF-2